MKIMFIVASFLILSIDDAVAQIDIQSRPLALLSACFNDAINNQRISKSGQKITFRCEDNPAKAFFEFLYTSSQTSETTSPNGTKTRWRFINSIDACVHMYEDANGRNISRFGCMLTYQAGDFINR